MVKVTEKKVTIPTYEPFAYDKNPMFLEKRVYQGSSGRVYPHPVCEGISDKKTDKEYKAIYLENEYLLVMILPELGGRIQRLYDKTNGYDAVYYNEVVKPALVGLAGPWISGGIEFNWPQHHRPSTFDPVDYAITHNEDGSITVTVGEVEKMFHTKGNASFTVYPDKAYLEIKGRVYNPTDSEKTFLWWANPAVSVNNDTRSIFPPDVTAVFDHGKRDVSEFPIAKGVYYKVNYAPGTDISRYRNIPVPTSYMAHHSDYDFIGNYDDGRNAGLLHVADHHVSPGKKQWTWGNGDFGRAWDRNLTDENGPYIELMTGVFTDNQPDFTYLKPYEEKTFKQYFMPYKNCGAVKNANTDYAMNLEIEHTDEKSEYNVGKENVRICVYSCAEHKKPVEIELYKEGEKIYSKKIVLGACESFEEKVYTDGKENPYAYKLVLKEDGEEKLVYASKKVECEIPKPQPPMKEPKDIKTTEELLLCGMHLEQYRHATFNPADYYLEGLRRDETDIRLNNAYGKWLASKGRYKESIQYFEKAVKKSTWLSPNPYDCEVYYNLGISLKKTGDRKKAYDAFYKATWDAAEQDKAFLEIAFLEAEDGKYEAALDFVNKSIFKNYCNLKARGLKSILLRRLGKNEEACMWNKETMGFDPLDIISRYELHILGESNSKSKNESSWDEGMRKDNADLIELGLLYIKAGMTDEAMKVFEYAYSEADPMINYYRFFCSCDGAYLDMAEKSEGLYCFPNRLEDTAVLEKAVNANGIKAGYYLGCLLYDKGRFEEAIKLWERTNEKTDFPTSHRNLALAYYNKLGQKEKAKKEMERAFELDKSDPRVFFELDQLYKELGESATVRLEKMLDNKELLEQRDPLYTEYITLLIDTGKAEYALDLIKGHHFHPWEGGEGKITAQYKKALIELSKKESDEKKACNLLKEALFYPENLGEGRLVGQLDNDIYYHLAMRTSCRDEREKFLRLASRGETNFERTMYYNDQPPEMMYYRAMALKELGEEEEALKIFNGMEEYGKSHMNDEIKIDYFAVSLPDFLIFEADLNKKNKEHCENMIKLSAMGKGKKI